MFVVFGLSERWRFCDGVEYCVAVLILQHMVSFVLSGDVLVGMGMGIDDENEGLAYDYMVRMEKTEECGR